MPYFKKHIAFGVAALISVSAAHASILVIGSPDLKVNQLTKQQVDDIYLGKNASVSTGEQLQPLDQSTSSVAYQQFYQNLMGWDPGQISSYWSSQTFSGEGSAPVQVNSDAQAIATVASNQAAIAYIDSNSLKLQGGRIKVLYGDFNGSGSGTNYYPAMGQTTTPAAQQPVQQPVQQQKTQSQPNLIALQQQQQQAIAQQKQKQQQAVTQQQLLPATHSAAKQTPVEKVTFSDTQQQNAWSVIQKNLNMPADIKNPQIQHELLWYLSHREVLQSFFENAKPYLGYVLQQVQARHMPAELALLPMIESGYNPLAYSKAGAAGLWQMMPGTASSYGLDIDWWYDSRSDVMSSTDAALNYLRLLHKNLGSWDLALAGYDAGQGAVQASIEYNQKSGHDTSFWNLPLPSETRGYVPKLLALAEIIRNPAKYHVQLPYIPSHPYFSSVTLNAQLDLSEIAHFAQIPLSLVKSLNPGLRRWATDPDAHYTLLLPTDKVATFTQNIRKVQGKTHVSWQYHEVHDGETLAKISKNYHASIATIEKVNNLNASYVPPETGLLVPLYLNRQYQPSTAVTQSAPVQQPSANDTLPIVSAKIITDNARVTPAITPQPVQSQPIQKNQGLKSLLTKIYGAE